MEVHLRYSFRATRLGEITKSKTQRVTFKDLEEEKELPVRHKEEQEDTVFDRQCFKKERKVFSKISC